MSLIFAHRGASAYAPENTIEAFLLAKTMGADGFELDVHLSSDGELVVIHDERVDRTTNGTGLIKDLPYKNLQKLDASYSMNGFHQCKIPSLFEVLELIRGTDLLINIEIKTDNIQYAGIEEKTVNAVHALGVQNQIIYSSFNHYSIMKIKEIDKYAKTALLYTTPLYEPWKYAFSLEADYLHPHWHNLSIPGYAEESRKLGIGVNAWTVNTAEGMNLCIQNNIGIITNYPDIALNINKEYLS